MAFYGLKLGLDLEMRGAHPTKTSKEYPRVDILFIGCVLNKKIVYTTAKEVMFEAFY